MAIKQKITYDQLENMGACKELLQFFKEHFKNKAYVLDLLKKCAEYEKYYFGYFLTRDLPFNENPLKLHQADDKMIFYNGDVLIEHNTYFKLQTICISGTLTVIGKLYAHASNIEANTIKSTIIEFTGGTHVRADIKTHRLEVCNFHTQVDGNIKASVVNLKDSCEILGNIETVKIYNELYCRIRGKTRAKIIDGDGVFIGGIDPLKEIREEKEEETNIIKEFKITHEFIENYPDERVVKIFREIFPRAVKVTEIPKLIPYLGEEGKYSYRHFTEWLLDKLPFNEETLIIEGDFCGNIFYNGAVWIKRYAHICHSAFIKGSLKVNARLSANRSAIIQARHCTASVIRIDGDVTIDANVTATEKLLMNNGCSIEKNVEADYVSLNKSCWVFKNVKANELQHCGVICGDVEANYIDSGDGGEIWGKVKAKLWRK